MIIQEVMQHMILPLDMTIMKAEEEIEKKGADLSVIAVKDLQDK
jgi:hypothetical protein